MERLQAPIKSDANEEAGKQGTKRCFEKSNADHNLAFNVTFLRCAKYSQLIRLCDIVALTADTTLRITALHEPAPPLGTFPQRPGNGTIQVFMFYGHNITRFVLDLHVLLFHYAESYLVWCLIHTWLFLALHKEVVVSHLQYISWININCDCNVFLEPPQELDTQMRTKTRPRSESLWCNIWYLMLLNHIAFIVFASLSVC